MTSADGNSGLAIAFSGGGFRATLFHLGVARRLLELGLLDRTEFISGTSGGAIFAAYLLSKWPKEVAWTAAHFEREVQRSLLEAITKRNFRMSFLWRTVGWAAIFPLYLILHPNLAEQLFMKEIFGNQGMDALPKRPQIFLNTTELRTGTSFRFTQSKMSSYWDGPVNYADPGVKVPTVAAAVAASAAFPIMFRDQKISLPNRDGHPSSVRLVDGGIYDNLAVEPFLKREFDRKHFIVISDAGYPADHTWRPRLPYVSEFARLRNIGLAQADNIRRRWIFESLSIGHRRGCFVRLSSSARAIAKLQDAGGDPNMTDYPEGLPEEVVKDLAKVRTDLDRFSESEAALISFHGYTLMDACLLKFHAALRSAPPRFDGIWAGLNRIGSDQGWRNWAERVLAASGSRWGRRTDPVRPAI